MTSWEILALKRQLAERRPAKRFVLQGGDCAGVSPVQFLGDHQPAQGAAADEPGARPRPEAAGGARGPLRRASTPKPRSADTETIDGVTLPCYRGDMVNVPRSPRRAHPGSRHGRACTPAMTMKLRALIDGGFADLHHPEFWDLVVGHAPPIPADGGRIGDAVRFMEPSPAGGSRASAGSISTPRTRPCCSPTRSPDPPGPAPDGWFNLSSPLSVDRHAHNGAGGRTSSTSAASATRSR